MRSALFLAILPALTLVSALDLPRPPPQTRRAPAQRAPAPRAAVLDQLKLDEIQTKPRVPPVFNEVCSHTGVTLSRYMCEVARANPELEDMQTLMSSIQTAVKTIASLVARSHITGMVGAQGAVNVQGEEQKKLDVITNEVLKDALRFTGKMGVIASEEEDFPVDVLDDAALPEYDFETIIDETSRYIAVFDPLDGSSNVDAGVPTGTIFGIFEHAGEGCVVCEEELDDDCSPQESVNEYCITSTLKPGSSLVASGYCLYSSSTFFCLPLGAGVQMFVLDPLVGEFRLTHPNVKLPSRGSIYSLNEGNRGSWDAPLREYVSAIQDGRGESGKPYSSRYIGSMVGDVHRTLLYGGIFGYPADAKNPDGKLRLLYEAAPMAYLVEQAGGLALTGKTRVMDLLPRSVHQRVPVLLGSRDDVLECRSFYEASTDPELAERCLSRLEPGQPLDTVMDTLPDSVALDTTGDGRVDTIKRLVNERDQYSS